jgi:hypothetical protein
MAAMDVSSWGISLSPEAASTRGATIEASRRRASRWHALGRLMYAAALASAMTDPQVCAMVIADQRERDQGGR